MLGGGHRRGRRAARRCRRRHVCDVGGAVRGMDVDILAEIGFIVLIGLAAKNAILIMGFARQAEEAGSNAREAAVQAARTRLRPILMTSIAFMRPREMSISSYPI